MAATRVAQTAKPSRRGSAPGVASRRRGEKLIDALLQAAWEEVTTVGYGNLTMEAVATRAGTAKSVIYRRWPNRAALVYAAMRHQLGSITDDIPDTGDMRQDVLSVLCHFRDRYRQVGPDIVHGLMSEHPDLPQEASEVTSDTIATIVRRAAERGEIRLNKLTPLIASVPGSLLRHELTHRDSDASDAFLAKIVDEVFLPLVVKPGRPTAAGARRQDRDGAGRAARSGHSASP